KPSQIAQCGDLVPMRLRTPMQRLVAMATSRKSCFWLPLFLTGGIIFEHLAADYGVRTVGCHQSRLRGNDHPTKPAMGKDSDLTGEMAAFALGRFGRRVLGRYPPRIDCGVVQRHRGRV